jgi:hypothetical protein
VSVALLHPRESLHLMDTFQLHQSTALLSRAPSYNSGPVFLLLFLPEDYLALALSHAASPSFAATAFNHCSIKTNTKEVGMGPAGNGPLPLIPFGIPTTLNDHTGQSSLSTCKPVCYADEP